MLAIVSVIGVFVAGCTPTNRLSSQAEHQPTETKVVPEPTLYLPKESHLDSMAVAGSYFRGTGHHGRTVLELNADHTMLYRSPSNFDQSTGSWKWEGQSIVCTYVADNAKHDRRFVPIQVLGRYFLVEENSVPGFLDAARKSEMFPSRHIFEYIRFNKDGIEVRPTRAEIPERYRDYYEIGEITARVSSVNKDGTITIGQDHMQRVKEGMLLVSDEFLPYEVQILKVTQNSATGKVRYYQSSYTEAAKGDILTSGNLYWQVEPASAPRYLKIPPENKLK